VARRYAFIAEIAVDFEYAIKTADHQPLQVQLRRDAQEHLHVQRVVMGNEGLGCRTTGNGMQHRRLHFHEVVFLHEATDRRHRGGTGLEGAARFFVHDQIDVTLAVLGFLVGKTVKLVGQRAQRFGQQAQGRDFDRQLAGFGLEQRAFGPQDVAQVKMLECFMRGIAGQLIADVQLDAAVGFRPGGILDGGEGCLAHHALEHHAPGHHYRHIFGQQCVALDCAVLFLQRGGLVLRPEIVGESYSLQADGGKLAAPFGQDRMFV